MLIQSKIERKKGTHVTLDGTSYHFAPTKIGGPHVASVTRNDHIARFLGITEGYKIYEDDEDDIPVSGDDRTGRVELSNNPVRPRSSDDDLSQFEAGDVGTMATAGSQATAPQDPAKTDGVAERAAATAIAALPDHAAHASTDLGAATIPLQDVQVSETSQQVSETSQQASQSDSQPATDMDEAELRATYEKLNGRAAPANTKIETLVERIKQMQDAEQSN